MYSYLLPALPLCVTLILTIVIIEWLIPALTKRGVNTSKYIEAAGSVIKSASSLTDVLMKVFPASPIPALADKIIEYARIGVQKAEQLYYVSTIQGSERKETAMKFVYDALELAGIDRNAAIDKIIDGAIEAAVLELGHYADEEITISRKVIEDDEPPDADGSELITPDLSDPETTALVSELLADNTMPPQDVAQLPLNVEAESSADRNADNMPF